MNGSLAPDIGQVEGLGDRQLLDPGGQWDQERPLPEQQLGILARERDVVGVGQQAGRRELVEADVRSHVPRP